MAKTDITAQYLRDILNYDQDTGIFRWSKQRPRIKVGDIAGTPAAKGHVAIKIDGSSYKAHRLAWLYMTGTWPKDQIDHINRIPDDNRYSNLCECNTAENCQNQGLRKNNTSGYQGVSFHKRSGEWRAMININGRATVIGSFADAETAGAAYMAAKRRHHVRSQSTN